MIYAVWRVRYGSMCLVWYIWRWPNDIFVPSVPDGDHTIHSAHVIQAPHQNHHQKTKQLKKEKFLARVVWVLKAPDEPAYSTMIV